MFGLAWRWIAIAAAFAGSTSPALISPAVAAPGWTASPDDALLFDTRLGQYQIGEGVRGYATDTGSCLIFADVAVTLDLAIAADPAAGTLRGWAFTETNRVEVDTRARIVRVRGRSSRLAAGTVRDTPEGWCVDTDALSDWLGITLTADRSAALLFVKSAIKLPVELAQERKARAAAMRPTAATADPAKLPRVKLPYLIWRTPALDAVVTIGGIRDRSGGGRASGRGSRIDARYELFASGEVARLSVDARLASDDHGMPATLRARAYRTDPGGRLLGPLRATNFALGDVNGFASPLVGLSIGGRGAIVTNRPVDRPDSFDRTTFRGELPAGWDAELYRNGQLLGFARDRTDGRYEFLDIPLLYGRNRIEIVLYGPQGQVRRRIETVAVGTDSIPTGDTFYWAGFSQDDRDLIELDADPFSRGRGWRGTAGVEHGIDAKTSLSAQLHSMLLENERLTYVEGAIRRAVGPALVELSGAYEHGGGSAARAQILTQIGETYISAEAIHGMRGYRSDRLDRGVIDRHMLAIDHNFTLGRTTLPTHLEARYVGRRDAPSTLEAAARLSSNFRNFSLTGGLDWQSRRARGRDPPGASSVADRLTAALLANGRIGPVRVRGEVRARMSGDRRGFEGGSVVGEWGASDRAQWRAELGYDGFEGRSRMSVGYSRRFDRFALGMTGEAASDGSVAAGLNLAFSVGSSARGGLRIASAKLGSSGSAIARVFRDLNEDGVRQADEPGEAGVQLTAGTSVVGQVTNAAGEAIIDDLTPYRPITIGVDTSSLSDPLIQPKLLGQRVIPRPGIAFRLDIPLVGAGEVEGTLVSQAGRGIEGLDLELVDAADAVIATQRSDFDGYFLFEGVPYGQYALRIAALSAQAAKLMPILSATAKIGAATPTVRLGTVTANSAELRTAAQ